VKSIILTFEVNDGGKPHDEEQVKDTAGYFLEDVMNALQEIHQIVVKSVDVEVK
jgi:hypothetical protein